MRWNWILIMVFLALSFAGCSGVWMNAKYANLLDQSCGWAQEAVDRADANQLTPDEMKRALATDANFLRLFRDARDGKAE